MFNTLLLELRNLGQQALECSFQVPSGNSNCAPQPLNNSLNLDNKAAFDASQKGNITLRSNVEQSSARKSRNMVKIPKHFEQYLITLNILQADSIMYSLVVLPLTPLYYLMELIDASTFAVNMVPMIMLAGIVYLLLFMDHFYLYHLIKSQGFLKLYFLHSLLETFDIMLGRIGKSVYINSITKITGHTRQSDLPVGETLASLVFSFLVMLLHTILLLVYNMTYTISMNSGFMNFLLMLISFNFGELRGVIYKNFDRRKYKNLLLFDVNERMMVYLFSCLTTLTTLDAVHWDFYKFRKSINIAPVLIIFSEMLTDWMKHCFVLNEADLDTSVYDDYAYDLHKIIADSSLKKLDPISFSLFILNFNPIPIASVSLYIIYTSMLQNASQNRIIGMLMIYIVFVGLRMVLIKFKKDRKKLIKHIKSVKREKET